MRQAEDLNGSIVCQIVICSKGVKKCFEGGEAHSNFKGKPLEI